MLPLLLAGGIWAYNAVRIAQIRNERKNHISRRNSDDQEETKNLAIYKDCTFKHEDRRTYNSYNNCTFNYYIIKKGDDDE
jgi:hypothetical protein